MQEIGMFYLEGIALPDLIFLSFLPFLVVSLLPNIMLWLLKSPIDRVLILEVSKRIIFMQFTISWENCIQATNKRKKWKYVCVKIQTEKFFIISFTIFFCLDCKLAAVNLAEPGYLCQEDEIINTLSSPYTCMQINL